MTPILSRAEAIRTFEHFRALLTGPQFTANADVSLRRAVDYTLAALHEADLLDRCSESAPYPESEVAQLRETARKCHDTARSDVALAREMEATEVHLCRILRQFFGRAPLL